MELEVRRGGRGSDEGERLTQNPSTGWSRKQLFLRVALRRPAGAEKGPFCVSCNSTSKRLIKELIRANLLWNLKLDRGWLLWDGLHPSREKRWKYGGGMLQTKCFMSPWSALCPHITFISPWDKLSYRKRQWERITHLNETSKSTVRKFMHSDWST